MCRGKTIALNCRKMFLPGKMIIRYGYLSRSTLINVDNRSSSREAKGPKIQTDRLTTHNSSHFTRSSNYSTRLSTLSRILSAEMHFPLIIMLDTLTANCASFHDLQVRLSDDLERRFLNSRSERMYSPRTSLLPVRSCVTPQIAKNGPPDPPARESCFPNTNTILTRESCSQT